MSVSSEGLEEVPLPNGGVIVDLQGRFQSAVFATTAPDGTVRLSHDRFAVASSRESVNEEPTSGGAQ